jgi:hypothetical protein
VAYPGDTLITEGWPVASGAYVIQTTNQDGKIIKHIDAFDRVLAL